MSVNDKHFYEFGPFRLDPVKRRLIRDGEVVPLTPKAFDTLLVLVQQRGKTIEKDDLMNRVWPDAVVEENNLNQNITALRRSLGDSRQKSSYIATIPGLGYRFVAEVQEVEIESAGVAEEKLPPGGSAAEATSPKVAKAEVSAPAAAQSAVAPPDLKVDDRLPSPFGRVLVVLVLLGFAIVGYAFFIRAYRQQSKVSVTSIAVLPLENISGDPAQEYFADGVTDALIGDLAKIAELRVISRTSSMHYKGMKKSLPEIANELKVDAIVEGTVQRSGDRVLVRAQLIHAATDRHLWVETYERDVKDVLNLQSEIAQAIAREVRIKISPAEQARLTPRRPVHTKALDAYLQGRYLYWNKRSEENLHKAIEYFQIALKEDPNYAPAYAGLADCYNNLGSVMISAFPPTEGRRRAEEAASKALELDSTLAEAHSALGSVKQFSWDWDAAEREYKLAIELNPSYAHAYSFYAGYLSSRGRVEESLAASTRARELDPLSFAISAQRGFLLGNARRYDEAIEQLRSVLAVDPNHFFAYWLLGHIYAFNGQLDEAVAAEEKAVSLSDRAPGALGMLGLVYGLAGRKSEARKVLNELLKLHERRYVTPVAIAYVYIGLGEKDQAFVWLEKAYQERSNYIAYLNVNPIGDSLRSDPRFDDMLRRVGLLK